MKTLAIESSAKSASAAIVEDGSRLIAETFINNGFTHSKTLMPMIEDLFNTSGIALSEIDKIAVATGPGSFTGLRIGVAAAKGLAYSLGIPCCGVSTLEAMACGLSHISGLLCAVMDARAGQVYNALFTSANGKLIRESNDRAISIVELTQEIICKKRVIMLGDGAKLCYNMLKDKYLDIALAPEQLLLQRAWGVAMAAENVSPVTADKLEIKYIRLPQAERERLEKLRISR